MVAYRQRCSIHPRQSSLRTTTMLGPSFRKLHRHEWYVSLISSVHIADNCLGSTAAMSVLQTGGTRSFTLSSLCIACTAGYSTSSTSVPCNFTLKGFKSLKPQKKPDAKRTFTLAQYTPPFPRPPSEGFATAAFTGVSDLETDFQDMKRVVLSARSAESEQVVGHIDNVAYQTKEVI